MSLLSRFAIKRDYTTDALAIYLETEPNRRLIPPFHCYVSIEDDTLIMFHIRAIDCNGHVYRLSQFFDLAMAAKMYMPRTWSAVIKRQLWGLIQLMSQYMRAINE